MRAETGLFPVSPGLCIVPDRCWALSNVCLLTLCGRELFHSLLLATSGHLMMMMMKINILLKMKSITPSRLFGGGWWCQPPRNPFSWSALDATLILNSLLLWRHAAFLVFHLADWAPFSHSSFVELNSVTALGFGVLRKTQDLERLHGDPVPKMSLGMDTSVTLHQPRFDRSDSPAKRFGHSRLSLRVLVVEWNARIGSRRDAGTAEPELCSRVHIWLEDEPRRTGNGVSQTLVPSSTDLKISWYS